MAGVNILNNTILVPTSDSLTGSSHDIKPTTIATDISKFNQKFENLVPATELDFSIEIVSNNVKAGGTHCSEIRGLSVSRPAEKRRSGGEAFYEMNLPGMVSYGEVTFFNIYTNSEAFLNWLINGAAQGGAMLADVSITIGNPEFGQVVYTLRDAFPTSWRLGNLAVINLNEIDRYRTRQIAAGEFPLEEMTIAYGRLDYSKA